MNSRLKESIQTAPIISKGSYAYLIHPLFDGFPFIDPSLLEEVAVELKELISSYLPFDRIITVEAMGIPIATLLSQHLDIPLTIIRKRHYGIQNEICIQQETGYSTTNLYVNGIQEDESLIFVDDIISTGGTFTAIAQALKKRNTLKAGFFIINKGTKIQEIIKKTEIPLHSLLHISIQDKQVQFHQ